MTKKVVLYCRVSSEILKKDLDRQKRMLVGHCLVNEYDLVWEFMEIAPSSDQVKWLQLMEFVAKNNESVDLVLATDWDRFSRDRDELRNDGLWLFKEFGICLDTVETPVPETELETFLYSLQ